MTPSEKFPRKPFFATSSVALRALSRWLANIPMFSAIMLGSDCKGSPIIKIGHERISPDGATRRWIGQDLVLCASSEIQAAAVKQISATFGDKVQIARPVTLIHPSRAA